MFQGRKMLDELNRTLLIAGLACSILSALLFRNVAWARTALSVLSAGCLIFAVIRLLGGNPDARSRENMRYLTVITAVRDWFSKLRAWFRNVFRTRTPAERQARPKRAHKARKNPTWAEIRQYKYFICPQCAQRLRVPRGKGKLRVTCTKCGNVFETKS